MKSPVPPQDEFVHLNYPRGDALPWKENWYFNFMDLQTNAWGANHISLQRHKQKGAFMAMHVVDGETLFYRNEIDLAEDFAELTDGRLSISILEPHRSHRVTFRGEKHDIDLAYEARFDVFDYEQRGKGFKDTKSLAIEHYEQGMAVKGTLTKNGETRQIAGLGHRDHSWGYRNEENLAGWNWVAAQFPGRTINLSIVHTKDGEHVQSGFISTTEGNLRIHEVGIRSTVRDDKDAPVTSIYEFRDETSRIWTMKSVRFSSIYVPMKDPTNDKVNGAVHENFSEFALVGAGEKGAGIDEYMMTMTQ